MNTGSNSVYDVGSDTQFSKKKNTSRIVDHACLSNHFWEEIPNVGEPGECYTHQVETVMNEPASSFFLDSLVTRAFEPPQS